MCEKAKLPTNVYAIYFNVAKAFDTVCHRSLLHNLQVTYYLPHHQLSLLKAYLTNRTMRVREGESLRSIATVDSGVVQGSTIGPVLLNAFINTVAQLNVSENSELIMFADDLGLIHPLNEPTAEENIQEDIDQIISAFKT